MADEVEGAIAGARLADGRQVFVAGAPLDLQEGTRIALLWNVAEWEGIVSIAPRQLPWRDPEAPVGRFLAVLGVMPSPAPLAAEPPLALFLAEDGAPDPARLAAMLSLAREEIGRLDD